MCADQCPNYVHYNPFLIAKFLNVFVHIVLFHVLLDLNKEASWCKSKSFIMGIGRQSYFSLNRKISLMDWNFWSQTKWWTVISIASYWRRKHWRLENKGIYEDFAWPVKNPFIKKDWSLPVNRESEVNNVAWKIIWSQSDWIPLRTVSGFWKGNWRRSQQYLLRKQSVRWESCGLGWAMITFSNSAPVWKEEWERSKKADGNMTKYWHS